MQENHLPHLIGELRGILATFEWANGRNDLVFTFTFEELPPEKNLQSSLDRHFGNLMTDIRVEEIKDWSATLGNTFRNWFFQYIDLLKSFSFSALTDRSSHEQIVDHVLELIRSMHPIAVGQVQGNPFGECAWEFRIEVEFLSHFMYQSSKRWNSLRRNKM